MGLKTEIQQQQQSPDFSTNFEQNFKGVAYLLLLEPWEHCRFCGDLLTFSQLTVSNPAYANDTQGFK